MDSNVMIDFKRLPIEIALKSLPHMSKHLQLQYDGQPPPFLLALAPKKDTHLEIVYTEAQKIYKDINLRVDHSNIEGVGRFSQHSFNGSVMSCSSRIPIKSK
jgi:hypothetical protein